MQEWEKLTRTKIILSFEYDMRTGETIFHVEMISPKGTSQREHNAQHRRYMREWMEQAGVLRDGTTIQVQEGNLYHVTYTVTRKGEGWRWREVARSRVRENLPERDAARQSLSQTDKERGKDVS